MQQRILLPAVDFGQPEAENDRAALRTAFYEGDSWRRVIAVHQLPFVVGRTGAGKSAIATRLEIEAEANGGSGFLRIVPANFRHVEIRALLTSLVNESVSWQYIYGKVWEGIILGQIVQHLSAHPGFYGLNGLSAELTDRINEFRRYCSFYAEAIDDALTEVIVKYVRAAAKKINALELVDLRHMLEPYNWSSLIKALRSEFEANVHVPRTLVIAVDGLDDHWDVSSASLFFLAQLLSITKQLAAKFGPHVQFVVCLRDSIFRALVDTKSVEYDKLESLIINLQWSPRSLFELIAARVAPRMKKEEAVYALRELLPEDIDGIAIDEYLSRHLLNRPRDYINFFRMLQVRCGREPRAGEGHVKDTLSQYCANRLVDLENEFGFTYPGISKCIAGLGHLEDVFAKDALITSLSRVVASSSFRAEAPDLIAHYGQPLTLARILISIGVIGCYDKSSHTLRFVHEFSESRVQSLWENVEWLAIHPVYRYKGTDDLSSEPTAAPMEPAPAIVTYPPDYLPSKDNLADLEPMEVKKVRRRSDLIAELAAIERGQPHYQRWEAWVRSTIDACFSADLTDSEAQIRVASGEKRFEMIFDIYSDEPPWQEIKDKYRTHRLLVECKNTEEPTDADFSKLVRDMAALSLSVSFLAYRGSKREPSGKILEYQRSRFNEGGRKIIILAISEAFLLQCLQKKHALKCRHNLNMLWRDHLQRWLVAQ